MAYRFATEEEPQAALRRIAAEQIGKAIEEIGDADKGPHERVHQTRKRCKKLRGLLRLVRSQLGSTYGMENKAIRDSARTLSETRDATSVLESFESLMKWSGSELDARRQVREVLERRRDDAETLDLEDRLAAVKADLKALETRARGWLLEGDGFEAMRGGIEKTYGRGRDALDTSLRSPTTETLHEWRKRVKYHWYHMRLLRDAWRPFMDPRIDALGRLSDVLGDDHDLAVLQQTVLDCAGRLGPEATSGVSALIAARRAELQATALLLGRRLLADKPSQFAFRLERWWACSREERCLRRCRGSQSGS